MQKASLIIAVPHAQCASKDLTFNEFCDETAKSAAELIGSGINEDLVELSIVSFESDAPIIDMDTYMSRNTTFRQNLTQIALDMIEKYGDKVVLIDIHSFPTSERPEWKDSEVVIVETRTLHDALESVGLSYYLNNNGIKTKVVIGTEVDIAQEMDSLGIMNIVLEFNQQISDRKLNQITTLISKWIQKPAGSVPTSGIRSNGHRGWGGHGYRGRSYDGSFGGGFGGGILLGAGLGILTTAALSSGPRYGYGYGYGPAYGYSAYPPPAYGYSYSPPVYPYYY